MRTITIQTNYNNKMSCHCFIHIDAAPAKRITESELEQTIVEIQTMDNSHPPVKAKILEFIRLPLASLSDVLTWPSHGMNSTDFLNWIYKEQPKYEPTKEMAVYFYKRQI